MNISWASVDVFTYCVYLVAACCVVLGVYRLAFHPLSGYSGPVTARLSGLFGAYFAARRDLHTRTWRDHIKYGRVVRHGPNKLVFDSVEALHDIYHNALFTKSHAYAVAQRPPGVFGLFDAIDPSLHFEKRRLVSRAVNGKPLHEFELAILGHIDVYIRELLRSCQDTGRTGYVDIAVRLKYLALDIMAHRAFDFQLNLQTQTTYRYMTTTPGLWFFNVALQLPSLRKLASLADRYRGVLIWGDGYLETLDKMAKSRLANSPHAKKELAFMSDSGVIAEDENAWLDEIRTEALFFISAGSDTVTTCLSAMFFYLSRHQDCYDQVAREIRSAFSSSSQIRRGTQLAKCAYLRACIDETLRISPPLPGTLWREPVTGANGTLKSVVVDGHVIPPHTQVGVNTYALHHNETYFPEPFRFKPQRWIPSTPEFTQNNRKAFAPFSVGARSCVGLNMAYLEISLIAAKTLWHFDFEAVPGWKTPAGKGTALTGYDEYVIHDQFSAVQKGPKLRFKPREAGI
ncbi:cytochrome P450 [Xylariaceae sp. FL0804]|nr:cytochrome P450 [Xylariaceae sp. FL0804]